MAAALLVTGAGTVAAQTPSETNKKFGNWAYACRALKEDGPKRCVLFQNILWWKSGKRILNVSVARPSKDKPFVAAITAPLGILLPRDWFCMSMKKSWSAFRSGSATSMAVRASFQSMQVCKSCLRTEKKAV